MFQRVGPKAFKKDLDNIKKVCGALGDPHLQLNCIHIAGTNGKGSVAHMLAAVFTAAGFKTGLYTSPHYRDFRERIKINGQLIPKKDVTSFVDKNKPIFERIKPSFFEWTVGLAFDHFARENVDMAIIETGLGGRLDSTNVVKPKLSVITNIGFDHTEFLGKTLPLIAKEKAGIIKQNTPVVIGETHPETVSVFLQKAKSKKAPISFADQKITAELIDTENGFSHFMVKKNGQTIFPNIKLQHLGRFQQKNIVTALQSLFVFKNNHPDWFEDLSATINAGMANLKSLSNFIGRWEFISHGPAVLVDSAHNEEGIRQLVEALSSVHYNRLHFVLAVVKDKSHEKSFSMLPKDALYYFAKANIPRGMDAILLKEQANALGLKGKAYTSIRRALAAAKKKADPNDLIFVGGSIFTVAEVV